MQAWFGIVWEDIVAVDGAGMKVMRVIMRFVQQPSVVPNMMTWGAERDGFTFLVSRDDAFGGAIAASVKPCGARPFDGRLIELGKFASLAEAMAACERWRNR